MSNSDTSSANGKLMMGGITTLILGALLLIGNFVGALSLGGGGGPGEGAGIIILIVYLALIILSGIGWMGAGALYGPMNNLAGVFSFIFAGGLVLGVLGLLMMSLGMLQVAGYILMFAPALIGIFGGIGLLSGQARGSAGPLKPIAGIVLLVAGIATVWVALRLFGIALPIADVMAMVSSYGMGGGLVLGGLTMIMSRT